LPHQCSPSRGKTPRRATVPRGGDALSPKFWSSGRRAVIFFRSWLFACVQAGRTPARRGHDLAVEMPDASAFDVASCAASGTFGSRPSSRGVFPCRFGRAEARVERTPTLGPRVAAPPNGRCSRGVAASRRCALRVAPSAPVGRLLAQGLPSRGRAQRRLFHSHPSVLKGRRRRSGSSPAQGRAARPQGCLAFRRAPGVHEVLERCSNLRSGPPAGSGP
jgi:hypothetical protein